MHLVHAGEDPQPEREAPELLQQRGSPGADAAASSASAGGDSRMLPARSGVGRCRYTRLPRLVKARPFLLTGGFTFGSKL